MPSYSFENGVCKHRCYIDDLQNYFEEFNNTFKRKEKPYKKIKYDIWKSLKRVCEIPNRLLVVELTEALNYIVVYVPGHFEARSFPKDDQSFGSFLAKRVFGNEKEKEIKMNTVESLCFCNNTMSTANGALATTSANTKIDVTKVGETYTDTLTSWDYGKYSSNAVTGVDWKGIQDYVTEHENKYHNDENNKENEKMKFANFDFGPCTNDYVRISMYGLAVKNTAGTWVSYDVDHKKMMDVDVFSFEGGKYLFKIPVAIDDVDIGDVIIHNKMPMFVEGLAKGGALCVVDPIHGETKTILPLRSPFGFDFCTKIVNIFDNMMNVKPNSKNPFGNMLPLFLMNDKNTDIDPMMMFMMMGGNNGSCDMMANPMMWYMMFKDGKSNANDMMAMMMLFQQQKMLNDVKAKIE